MLFRISSFAAVVLRIVAVNNLSRDTLSSPTSCRNSWNSRGIAEAINAATTVSVKLMTKPVHDRVQLVGIAPGIGRL